MKKKKNKEKCSQEEVDIFSMIYDFQRLVMIAKMLASGIRKEKKSCSTSISMLSHIISISSSSSALCSWNVKTSEMLHCVASTTIEQQQTTTRIIMIISCFVSSMTLEVNDDSAHDPILLNFLYLEKRANMLLTLHST